MLLLSLLPMASLPPKPQQPKTTLSRQTRGADCCIVVNIASWIGVYCVITSPPSQTYQSEQRRAAWQNNKDVGSTAGEGGGAKHNTIAPPLLFAGADATLPVILQQPLYSASLLSLLLSPHPLPVIPSLL